LILGDRSEGMLLTAAENLPSIASQIEYVNLKAEQLPFRSGQIDTVLTLHVLHHLDDLNIVLTEIKRVLSPGGMLFAATNGNRHMLQFRDALELCGVNPEYFKSVMGFSLQEGELKLLELFDHVECTHFQDTLEVTRVSPLLNYARSGMPDEQLDEQVDALGRLEHHWKEELDRKGVIQIEKQTGLFLAK
jgi:SAM-dependent methyltransferase